MLRMERTERIVAWQTEFYVRWSHFCLNAVVLEQIKKSEKHCSMVVVVNLFISVPCIFYWNGRHSTQFILLRMEPHTLTLEWKTETTVANDWKWWQQQQQHRSKNRINALAFWVYVLKNIFHAPNWIICALAQCKWATFQNSFHFIHSYFCIVVLKIFHRRKL